MRCAAMLRSLSKGMRASKDKHGKMAKLQASEHGEVRGEALGQVPQFLGPFR